MLCYNIYVCTQVQHESFSRRNHLVLPFGVVGPTVIHKRRAPRTVRETFAALPLYTCILLALLASSISILSAKFQSRQKRNNTPNHIHILFFSDELPLFLRPAIISTKFIVEVHMLPSHTMNFVMRLLNTPRHRNHPYRYWKITLLIGNIVYFTAVGTHSSA